MALRVHDRVAPLGRPLAFACVVGGYVVVALRIGAPNVANALVGVVPDAAVFPVFYLITFAYPAAYAVLALVAALGVVLDNAARSQWSRRDHIHVYLAVAFAEWELHHLLYLLFPLTLLWGLLSFLMGAVYAAPVWGMACVAGVGVLIGNRYMWYHDSKDLPEGAVQHG